MRLFRQPAIGDWESVMSAVSEQLAAQATTTTTAHLAA
jgi:hypothetical protein